MIANGEVGNMGLNPLKDVEVITSYYDKNHNFIKYATALIEYNPIMPGQDSPYQTITSDNPRIVSDTTTFKFLMGAEIATSHYMDATERTYWRHRAGESEAERRVEDKTELKKEGELYADFDHHILNQHDHLEDYLGPLISFKTDGSFLLPMTPKFRHLPRQKQLQVEKKIESLCSGPNTFYFIVDGAPAPEPVIDLVHRP